MAEPEELVIGDRRLLEKPKKSKWNSFVGAPVRGRTVRGLEEESNPRHRARVEYSKGTILVHLSNEDGKGWTVMAVDRKTRKWAVAQDSRQMSAVEKAFNDLYGIAEED